MIKSMTGYGCAKGVSGKLNITVELRSVNNRFLDVSIHIPRVYTVLEDGIKAQVQKAISRGKVDVYVTIDASEADGITVSVNEPVAEAYAAAVRTLSERFGVQNTLTAVDLAKMQDVLFVTRQEADVEALGRDISEILERALQDFDAMRTREGEKLRDDVLSRADLIESLTHEIEERSPETVKEYREKLTRRMNEVLSTAGVDEQRILQEAAIYADKTAVAEETVRLLSHISQLRLMMKSAEPVGRKLDFLIQEFNREANTIGSKCSDIDITRKVVTVKGEIEKIREQVQNIE
ncbi:MAG: YicC family protein [Oscillospiraceae bacterium]|nr:YicC family protein [Oscillospiraceae bacterium]